MELQHQVVLVTGSSRGLGAEIARAFRKEGARVVINYAKNRELAEELVSTLGEERTVAIKGDVRSKADMQAVLKQAKEHFGHAVTTIVNNALVDFSFNGDARSHLDEIEWSQFNNQLEGAVKATLNTYQAAKDDMKDAKFGRIINIGTNLVQHPVVPYHDYNTAKAALISMTRNMAHEVGRDGINVNMVSGGLLYKTDASSATPDEVFDLIQQGTPLGEVTTPAEVADAVVFFASPWSRGITGQNLIVDGGLVMK